MASDATIQEELLRSGWLCVVMTEYGELCGITKMGGVPISNDVVLKCVHLAEERVKSVMKTIKEAISILESMDVAMNVGGGGGLEQR